MFKLRTIVWIDNQKNRIQIRLKYRKSRVKLKKRSSRTKFKNK